jgi:RNA polymerase sigma-70 factor (sigma-E family)
MAATDDEFRAFVRLHWGPLLRTAFLITGDRADAEDLVQAALEKVHRKWRDVAAMEMPQAYVRKIMVNTATSWRRRRSWSEIPTPPVEQAVDADEFDRIDQRQQLTAALRKVPPKMRAVLVLRYFEDLTEAQTAQVMGCSVGTVKSQTSRGLRRLREDIGPAYLGLTTALRGETSGR